MTNRHGELRMGQVVGTFGPGAMLDLPNHSVLVTGLNQWMGKGPEILEPRLVAKIRQDLKLNSLQLFGPPIDLEEVGGKGQPNGIRCVVFPEWFITQDEVVEDGKDDGKNARPRKLIHAEALTKGKWIDENRKKRTVVPVRFVRACRKGHIGDIDWHALAHRGEGAACNRLPYRLLLEERGTSGDITEVSVRCGHCQSMITMADAMGMDRKVMGSCDGASPWLGYGTKAKCQEPNRLLVRTASNAYFAQKITVISLPERDETVRKVVDCIWDLVDGMEDADEFKVYKKNSKVKAALEEISEEEMIAEIFRRKTALSTTTKPVKVAELETLISAKDEAGSDNPHGDYYARALPKTAWDFPWMKGIERIVLVHRLREVVAQIGFTRFEAVSIGTNGDLEPGVEPAPLDREVSWLPAIENRGEGVFIQFGNAAIAEWLARPAVIERGRKLETGFKGWCGEHPRIKKDFPKLPYYMLHSFAHMLITSVSIECGYPSSSIRERIYSLDGLGYGVLLYTGTSDAEGTLGGLVQVGRRIHEHIKAAIDSNRLCSNDPVCAEHEPSSRDEARFLHGAACHGCLLIAETSCESRNDFLDRALVVQTVDSLGAEFFSPEA